MGVDVSGLDMRRAEECTETDAFAIGGPDCGADGGEDFVLGGGAFSSWHDALVDAARIFCKKKGNVIRRLRGLTQMEIR
jgi:hypothetical protein